jgi:hypothetical protein
MKNPILRQSLLFLFCWRLRRHFVVLCATQLLTSSFLLQAQSPQGIPYQAIARNASGVAIANTAVKVRFSIRDSIATGAIKYQETHNPTTSALGLFSVNVGMGTVVSGTFSGINWGKNAKFLKVELNTTGGTTYTDLGTTQMMSVPFALYAGVAGNTTQSNASNSPSSDSVLTLVGAGKLLSGTYSVPAKETWKIVTVARPDVSTTTDSINLNFSSCELLGATANCYYNTYPELFAFQVGSLKYGGINYGTDPGFPIKTVVNCNSCPPFVKVRVFITFSNDSPVPIWLTGGEQITIGPSFVAFIEKYR